MNRSFAEKLLLNYRRGLVVLVHLGLWVGAFSGAFLLRFEFDIPEEYFPRWYTWLAAVLAVKVVCFAAFGMFSGMWRYTGARDLIALVQAAVSSSLVFGLYILMGGYRGFPRSLIIIDFLATVMLVGGLRFGIRTLWQLATSVAHDKDAHGHNEKKRRLLIVGAGNAGEMIMREMLKGHRNRFEPVGFVDDDKTKHGQRIHGVPVFGALADVPQIARNLAVEEIVIAIPSANGKEMRRIIDACKPAGVALRTIPGMDQVLDGQVTVQQIREVQVEDLLGREPVVLDQRSLHEMMTGRVVMVTGAGGSIGSELCRQLVKFKPSQLLLIERAENALFEIHRELAGKAPGVALVPCIADVCDAGRMEALFSRYRPSLVLHAAAHKHVPMVEWNPGEALKNNVLGTRIVAQLAHKFEAERFVMISTDKAVNPTSLMGATKRVAEIFVQALSQKSKTRFVAVRFGNVLGSAGSVIPIFKEQLKKGGPLTITHPEMRRYFMTIPEASQLVLQAGSMGRGGEIFVLDMGDPVKIVDLATDLITLSGLKPGVDIEIQFTGMRPGEKLFEEISTAEENADKTLHPKIFVGRLAPHALEQVNKQIDSLGQIANDATVEQVVARLKELVPELQRGDAVVTPPAAEVISLRRAGQSDRA